MKSKLFTLVLLTFFVIRVSASNSTPIIGVKFTDGIKASVERMLRKNRIQALSTQPLLNAMYGRFSGGKPYFAGRSISLSNSSVNENVARFTTIGYFSVDGVDPGLLHYSLTGGVGSTDNVTITNVNEAPTDIALSATSINENVAANSTVGTLSTTDVNAANTFTYTLVSGTGSTDNAAFNISGNSLRISASPDFESKSSYSIRIRTTDQGGSVYEKTFTVTINDITEGPNAFTGTQAKLAKVDVNQDITAFINISGAVEFDIDRSVFFIDINPATQQLIFKIIDGNRSSALVGGEKIDIVFAGANFGELNNVTKNIVASTSAATAGFSAVKLNSNTIRLFYPAAPTSNYRKGGNIVWDIAASLRVNNAPTAIALSATSINEHVASNTEIGVLSTTDPDAGNTFSYALVAGSGDTHNSFVNIDGNKLRIAASPDRSRWPSPFNIRIRTSDQEGAYFDKEFMITINEVNQLPTDITLSSTSKNENSDGSLGAFRAIDIDQSDFYTFTLVNGEGDEDNNLFEIANPTLYILVKPDYEVKKKYAIRVKGTDPYGASFEKAFTINVDDRNDAPTNLSLSATSINEQVSANSTVGTLTTSDQDANDTFTYTLVSGTGSTDNAAFNISGNSLRVSNSPDFETKSSYSIRIRTTDQGGSVYEKAFTITINDITEGPNAFTGAQAILMDSGVPLIPLKNITNAAEFDLSSYQLTLASIDINPSTQQLTLKMSGSSIFFSTLAMELDVVLSGANFGEFTSVSKNTAASTSGAAANVTAIKLNSNTVRITIPGFGGNNSNPGNIVWDIPASLPVNDAPTDMAVSASTLSENVAVNSTVGTLSTTDPDAGNTFTYTLVPGSGDTDNASFSISGSSLRITASPDFETKNSYSVRVRATDQGGLTFEKSFTININNVNEVPTDIALSAASINENVAANSTVGTLSTTDVDAGNTFTYTLVSGTGSTDNAAFNISGNSLRIMASPDFEYQNSFSVRVRTTDQGGLTYEKVFNITINNVNEAPTHIFLTQTSIAENSTANTTVGTLSPGDPDPAGSHSYSLVPGAGDTDNAAFNISGTSLKFAGVADFEAKSSYSIRMRITDQGGLTFERTETVTVTNVNEAPTDIALSAASINENVAANSTVGTLSSTDADASNTFTYTLVSGTGSTDNAAFNISGNELRITASPDFETKNSYSVRVRTTDQGGLTYEQAFTITINNVNETPTDIALSASSINENVAANSTVGTLSSTDIDASNTFTYTLVAGTGSTDNTAFTISGNSLRISASPDFETKTSYSIRVRTTDQGGLTFEKAFLISINDIFENAAPTDIALSASSINENVTANSTVGTLSSTDVDASNTFTYTLVSGTGATDNTAFNISGNILRITASPDFETKNSYSVRVRTTDQGGLTFEKAITITINNVNETPTDIALSASSINENVAANSTVGTLTSTDADASNTFTYTLVSGTGSTDNAAFSISGNSVRISASPDFETKNNYSIRVRTTDQGGLTFEKAFTITINNVNEAPTDIALSATAINENVAANSIVGTLSTSDADASNTFTYTLVAGTGSTDNAAFNISGNSLRISASPDFETKNNYSVRVRTTDQGGLTFEKAFTITINNVNEAPTDIALSATAINENVAANSTVGTLTSTDADASNTFTYTLVSGTGSTDNAAFNISGSSLRITASPDFETKNSYSVRVRTTDQGGLTYEKAFTITVNNLNETPTDIALSASSINENVAANSTVGTLSSTDIDASNTFTYTLVAGTGSTDNTAFTISGNSLRISASPDFETKTSYAVRIRTTDQDGSTFEKAFTIIINDLPELTFHTTSLTAAKVGVNYQEQINVTGGTGTHVFTQTAGSLPAGVSLATNGELTGTPTEDGSFHISIKATDQNQVTANQSYTINVNPPTLTLAATLTNAAVGATYSQTISTTGGTSPYTYTLASGALPNGLSLSSAGAIAGTPTLGGTFNFTVRTTDASTGSGPFSQTRSFAIIVAPTTQNIALNATATATYGDADFDPAATSTNPSTPITYSTSDNTIATIVNNKVHLLKAGTVTIYANQAASASFKAAAQQQQTLVINQKLLTAALTGTVSKTYDANTTATLDAGHFILTGKVGTDDVSIAAPASGNYANENAGTDKLVTVNGLALTGADQANYALTSTTANATIGVIVAKPITLSLNASPAITKVYDRTTAATLVADNYSLNGIETGDEVTIIGTASYANNTVGTGKIVSLNNISLGGIDQNNYNLITGTATTTGTITAKPIAVALNNTPAITKVYDGLTTAALAGSNYILTGVETGDALSLSATLHYSDKNVGTGKTITARAFVLTGAAKDNYSLTTTTAHTTGSITARPLTLTINASPVITKAYDGNSSATLAKANYNFTGLVNGDALTVNGTALYQDKNVGTGKPITVTNLTLGDVDQNNYNLVASTATTTGQITPLTVTVTADHKEKFAGTANPPLTVSYSGFIPGEDHTLLHTLPQITTTANLTSPIGTYPITPNGAAATNYIFNYVDGVLTVKPAAPKTVSLAAVVLYENRPASTIAGSLSSASDDPTATFTYTLVSGQGSADNPRFNIVNNELRTVQALDFEAQNQYSIRVRSTTQHGFSLEQTFVVQLSDVNEAPTLSAIANQVTCYTTTQQAVVLANITGGPESAQATTLSATSSNPSLFSELSVAKTTGTNGVLNYTIAPGASGSATITLTVKDNGGTANGGIDTFTQSFTITVNALPNVEIGAAKTTISKGETLQLTASGGISYLWNNSSGAVGTLNSASLTVRPSATTTYTVTATNTSGCSSSKSITISVEEDYQTIAGTNILTPNGDGKNDNLIIRNIDMYPNNEIKIFDRAGRLLYSKKQYDNSWGGTVNGSALAEGTYYYIIDFGPGALKKKGFVSIVRD